MKTSTEIIDAAIALSKDNNPQPAREVIESFRDNLDLKSLAFKIVLSAVDTIGKRNQFTDMQSLRDFLTEAAAKPDQNFILALHRGALAHATEEWKRK